MIHNEVKVADEAVAGQICAHSKLKVYLGVGEVAVQRPRRVAPNERHVNIRICV
jgi:hypothetical protein